jgi:hypothetical protein
MNLLVADVNGATGGIGRADSAAERAAAARTGAATLSALEIRLSQIPRIDELDLGRDLLEQSLSKYRSSFEQLAPAYESNSPASQAVTELTEAFHLYDQARTELACG